MVLSIYLFLSLPTPVKITPSDWQIYTHPNLNFSFRYPKEYQFLPFNPYETNQVDRIDSPDYLVKNGLHIRGISYSIYTVNSQCGNLSTSPVLSNIKPLIINGLTIHTYHSFSNRVSADGAQIPLPDNCLYLVASHAPNYDSIWESQFHQILSTIKFTQN